MPKVLIHFASLLLILFCCFSCQNQEKAWFKKLSSEQTGVHFNNTIQENEQYNMIDFSYLYNGGGVAIGDVNNDGLADIFFSGNQVSSQMYLNKGKLTFDNITTKAQLSTKGWCTGVSMVDINADGFLDIYVCKSGNCPASERKNQLFINDGQENGRWKGTFTEQAEKYGIANDGWSTQGLFFDQDKDGDLDLYVLNATNDDRQPNRIHESRELSGGSSASDVFYRNAGHNKFKKESIGIADDGWGLGISVGDFDNDGWEDLYVSNDFLVNDLVYINNQKGGFTEQSSKLLGHSSHFSMGNDIADFNNDGWQDIMVADMMPASNFQRKKMAGTLSNDAFDLVLQKGYLPQYMRNTLQMNNGRDKQFSEIGMMAGVYATDWSWSPLLADFDNDGWRDLFISNGYRHDIADMDFITDNAKLGQMLQLTDADKIIKETAKKQPEYKTQNRLFRNTKGLTFEDATSKLSNDEPSFSNGATYADLDNDGDLDIVANNIDTEASIYENVSDPNNYLKISLQENSHNRFALGATVLVYDSENPQVFHHSVSKGYQSSCDYVMTIGLGQKQKVDSLKIIWTDGSVQTLKNIKANQKIAIQKASGLALADKLALIESCIKPSKSTELANIVIHETSEEPYDDFATEPLLPHRFSTEGPSVSKGDINADGLEDYFVAGSLEKTGTFFIQKSDGTFSEKPLVSGTPIGDGGGCLLFDADNDQDLDLYIASGGNEFEINSRFYQDQFFVNDKGNFSLKSSALPTESVPNSCVTACDYDHDGDQDVFVGGRREIMKFGATGTSFLLENTKGNFKNITAQEPQKIGMVTSALWQDIDQDGWEDLLIAGEMMPFGYFRNNQGKLSDDFTKIAESGFWTTIAKGDFDKDGDTDFVLGNMGLNNKFGISQDKPYRVYSQDFDGNNYSDPIISYFVEGKEYPAATRDELVKQIPSLRKKINRYADFAKASLNDLFDASILEKSTVSQCKIAESIYVENQDKGQKFGVKVLPEMAQISMIRSIWVEDLDNDKNLDMILIGNSFAPEVGTGRLDANLGLILKGNGKGDFRVTRSSLNVVGDSRNILKIKSKKPLYLITKRKD